MLEIEIRNLNKFYQNGFKKHQVLKDFNAKLDCNRCNFLIGPNGTGKSTILKCLINLVKYQGEIIYNNLNGQLKITYAPEKIVLPDYLTIKQFLFSIAKINKESIEISRFLIEEYLQKFNLLEHLDKPIIKLSKGTKQKINLIQTLISDYDVYLYDEPLSGLDELSKEIFIKEIQYLRKKAKMIIISTHHLQDYRFKLKNIIDLSDYCATDSL